MTAPPLTALVRYFLLLGTTGFGGPVALANYIRRDLVERRRWIDEASYDRGLAIATACPGPMAYQLGVYCGYITHGVPGALAVAVAFALPPFIIVVAIAALYEHFSGSGITRGLFYGIGPVVVALILRATFNLGRKTLKRDYAAWAVALAACALTIVLQRELVWLFLAAGGLGIFAFAPRTKAVEIASGQPEQVRPRAFALPTLLAVAVPSSGLAPALFWFFFKMGFLVFGSGLVIVSFVKTYVVDQYHWLDNQTFVDAVAIGLISPGPVVITATFIGYAVDGMGGAAGATLGIFLPSIVLTIVATPVLLRYASHPRVNGFVRGVTVAVVGVLAGTTYLIGRPVIVDAVTIVVLLLVLVAPLAAKRIPDPVFVALGGLIGVMLRH
ncbi:MAG: chromate transporter [Candidatus Velthaea sp.]